jgi:hypothetical protein
MADSRLLVGGMPVATMAAFLRRHPVVVRDHGAVELVQFEDRIGEGAADAGDR